LLPRESKLGHRRRTVLEQALLVGGIDPRARNDARTVPRSDLVLERVDEHVERGWIDKPLFDEQRNRRPRPPRGPDGRRPRRPPGRTQGPCVIAYLGI
jgi:hypothetical protein